MPLPWPAPDWMSTLWPAARQLLDADGDEGHARFVRLDFIGHADHVFAALRHHVASKRSGTTGGAAPLRPHALGSQVILEGIVR